MTACARLPWALVAASVLLVGLVLYVLFVAYLPARQRIAELEAELQQASARQVQLQTRVTRAEQQGTARDRELVAVTAERDALSRRVEELERELATASRRRR